jgi:hypothetical protein
MPRNNSIFFKNISEDLVFFRGFAGIKDAAKHRVLL